MRTLAISNIGNFSQKVVDLQYYKNSWSTTTTPCTLIFNMSKNEVNFQKEFI